MSVLSRLLIIAVASCCPFTHAAAQQSGDKTAQGVNPKDNITKVEVLYKYEDFDQADNTNSLTFKYDKALNKEWGFNVELPFVRFDGFGFDETGLGDLQARLRYVKTEGRLSYIAAGELVLPTATGDALGRGQWQINPVAGIVFALSQTTFLFTGYKHFFSIDGEDERPDINESQPRVLLGYTDPKGWWLIGDSKYTKSWEQGETEALDVEGEIGQMVAPGTGVWVRAGTSFLDSDRDFGLNVGLRNIF